VRRIGARAQRGRRAIVGIRDLDDTSAIVGFAFREAELRGATLVAVHSWHGLPAAEADRNLAEALGPWREKYPAVPVRQDEVRDHPARALTNYTSRADLVVIGRHGPGAGPAIGGIQHAVLSHARGPVAIVPSPG
jgi:nucleotide-binding universal stress UspA family protein